MGKDKNTMQEEISLNKFKITDIGDFPVDWEIVKLGDKSNIFRGGSPRPIQAYLTSSTTGINWIKIGDVSPNAKYIFFTEEKIIPEGVSRSRTVYKGDFILSNSMSFGRPYILKINGCIHDGWLVIQDYKENFDLEFLYYFLCSDIIMRQYIKMVSGSSVLNLNKDKVNDVLIIKPPLPEQRAIATALSDTDAYIDTLEKLIAKKRAIKQGVMQELLTGKRRLPGFSGKWEEKKLNDLLTYEQPTNYIVSSTEYSDYGIPVLTAGKSLLLGYTNEHYGVYLKLPVIIFDDFTTESKYITYRFKVKSSAMKLLTSTGICDIRFVFKAMQMIDFPLKDHQRYWISEYSKLPIIIPKDKNEQIAIATVLSDMDAEIDTLIVKLNKIKNIKQGMMSELLTGRIRLIEKAEVKIKKTTKIIEFPKTEQAKKGHNQQFDDAVAFGVIVDKFFNPKYMLGRVKMYKLLYLLRRYQEVKVTDFTKKAAGPYKADARYAGGEKIAQENGYIVETKGKIGFSITKGEKISSAVKYADGWHWQESLNWLVSKFLYKSRDELETLATVDMAVCELQETGKGIDLNTVKDIISSNSEWKPKLSKPHFSDTNIKIAIKWRNELFGKGDVK